MKKILAIISLSLLIIISGGFKHLNDSALAYRYKIYANSNSANDLLILYQEKEYFINNYQQLIISLDPSLHFQAVSDNLDKLTKKGKASIINGVIVVVIGNGNGLLLEGELASNSCDSDVVNKKIFIIDWLFG